MGISKEISQAIADLYLTPLLALLDGVLTNPVFLKSAQESLESMQKNLSTSQAISGIMLDMDDVDIRGFQVETFEVAVKLLETRDKQREKTIELKGKQSRRQYGLDEVRKAMGY